MRNVAILLLAAAFGTGCQRQAGRPGNPEAATSEPLLENVQRVAVEGHPEVPAFFAASRTAEMEKHPCTRCHSVPLGQMRPVKPAAHWNVTLQHAKAETMQCRTCHADADKGELRMMEGAPVGFDHAYKVCGQCHAAQERDWAGGAHGKRVAGWAPPRVALSCTGCHDPHAPAFGKRWPAHAGRPEPMQ